MAAMAKGEIIINMLKPSRNIVAVARMLNFLIIVVAIVIASKRIATLYPNIVDRFRGPNRT